MGIGKITQKLQGGHVERVMNARTEPRHTWGVNLKENPNWGKELGNSPVHHSWIREEKKQGTDVARSGGEKRGCKKIKRIKKPWDEIFGELSAISSKLRGDHRNGGKQHIETPTQQKMMTGKLKQGVILDATKSSKMEE